MIGCAAGSFDPDPDPDPDPQAAHSAATTTADTPNLPSRKVRMARA
ncbi:hypothetical protein GCM10010198_66200 [Nocardia seriolae]|nr:hypothetical protein NSERUTF1_2848 [Nocardia seriolae]BEK87344.1 hypothetical protein NSERKGN1266_32950 [Nocardia seriolae]BEK96886.1 hypothetical protein NSER024013_47920 [Nocardia seriolae]GEM27967.1 hypothetical protein NS2_62060 [Nocardia seriolae NBRC 15557]